MHHRRIFGKLAIIDKVKQNKTNKLGKENKFSEQAN